MPWIRSDVDLIDHPKLRNLARRLAISKLEALGLVHCLWYWCARFSPSGELRRYAIESVAETAEWKGDTGELANALVNSEGEEGGFLDIGPEGEGYIVHDWDDYQRMSIKARERQKRYRERRKGVMSPLRNGVTSQRDVIVTLHDTTQDLPSYVDNKRKDPGDDVHVTSHHNTTVTSRKNVTETLADDVSVTSADRKDYDEVWRKALKEIKSSLNPLTFKRQFQPLGIVAMNHRTVTLGAPNRAVLDGVSKHTDYIAKVLTNILDRQVEVDCILVRADDDQEG